MMNLMPKYWFANIGGKPSMDEFIKSEFWKLQEIKISLYGGMLPNLTV